jgi:hypothetical protein
MVPDNKRRNNYPSRRWAGQRNLVADDFIPIITWRASGLAGSSVKIIPRMYDTYTISMIHIQ